MSTKPRTINMTLDRDPRYTAAQQRLTEMKTEIATLERARSDAEQRLISLVSTRQASITREAAAMVSGGLDDDAGNPRRQELSKSLDEVTHRLAVVRTAAEMQRKVIGDLRADISREIALDVLPQHVANVRAVFSAVLQLNTAMEAEADLRQTLEDNDVLYSAILRPMPVPSFGTLRDGQSRPARYMLECHEFGFVAADQLPDAVRDWIPPPPKAAPAPARVDNDGWLHA